MAKKYAAVELVDQASQFLPTADPFRLIREVAAAFQDCAASQVEIARIQATRDAIIAEIHRRYDLLDAAIGHIFNERSQALEATLALVRQGVEQNRNDLISQGLAGVATVITTSPFANFGELARGLSRGEKVEL